VLRIRRADDDGINIVPREEIVEERRYRDPGF